MKEFALRPDAERRDILEEAARLRNVTSIIMEKDFWVCWTLERLYSIPELAKYITFKGGTSLSKAYGLIDRFSEDIDLTISRDAPYLADGKDPMESGISNKERERRIDALKDNAQRFVEKLALPALQERIDDALKGHNFKTFGGWKLVLDEEDKDHQTLLFFYPRVFSYGMGYGRGAYGAGLYGEGELGYIRPTVRLEFGARGETEPHETKTIRPYVAEIFPQFFTRSDVDIPTLATERTFWEKATILHALHHGSKLRERMSRHYYDTYMLLQKGVANAALDKSDLLEQVVRNKSLLFKDNKASYDTAKQKIIGQLIYFFKVRSTLESSPVRK